MSVDLSRDRISTLSSNVIENIVAWVKNGHCVLFHTAGRSKLVAHKCLFDEKEETKTSFDNISVFYLDVHPMNYLLFKNELPAWITRCGIECHCDLKDRVDIIILDDSVKYHYPKNVHAYKVTLNL